MAPVEKSRKCDRCYGFKTVGKKRKRPCPECNGMGEIVTHKNGKPVRSKKEKRAK